MVIVYIRGNNWFHVRNTTRYTPLTLKGSLNLCEDLCSP